MDQIQGESLSSLSRTTSGSSQTTIGLGTVSGRAILALGEFAVRGMERFGRQQPLFALHQPLASRSTLSLSYAPTSDYSSETGDSSSTVLGPGHLSGRVIKALGALTLDTIDEIWLRRRLAEIKVFFPHGKIVSFTEDDGKIMYDNILELSWPLVYSPVVRASATAFIIAQIAAEEVGQLVRAIQAWNLVDLLGFLRHLIETTVGFMKASSFRSTQENAFPWPELWKAMTSFRVPRPLFIAFATFLFQLSLASEAGYQASLAVCPFLINRLGNPRRGSVGVVNYLRILIESDRDPSHDIPLLQFEPLVRRNVWKQLTRLPEPMPIRKQWVGQRKQQIDRLLLSGLIDYDEQISICCDLVEFCRRGSAHIDPGINEWAFEWILVYIARSDIYWDALIDVLVHGDEEDQSTILINALYQLLPYIFLGKSETRFLTHFTNICQQSSVGQDEGQTPPLVIFFRFLHKAAHNDSLRRVLDRESLLKILAHFGITITRFAPAPPQFLGVDRSLEAQLCWEIFNLYSKPTDKDKATSIRPNFSSPFPLQVYTWAHGSLPTHGINESSG